MTNYTPADQFPVVQIYDTNSPVLGGSSGDSNIPVKQLADRTEWLSVRNGCYRGHRVVTADANITADDRGKLIVAVKSDNMTLSLAAVAGFRVGAFITIKAKTTSLGKAVRILPNGSEALQDGIINYATRGLYLHDGELLELVAGDADGDGTADYWEVNDLATGLRKTGLDDFARVLPRNCLVANGCILTGTLYNRADFPRLWAAVSDSAIDDITWLSGTRFQGFFSNGNGVTTFRVPDMRGMFMRGLDAGRGISIERLDQLPGGYEVDAFLSHNHTNGTHRLLLSNATGANTPTSFDFSFGEMDIKNGMPMVDAGGSETRPKNIGFTPIIYI